MAVPSTTPASGAQYPLRAGGYQAVIAGVGASLRVLRDGEGDLVVPFDADEPRPAMRGALLAPWPNRTADGRYRFGGVEHRLPVNEPATGNASHGLAADLVFEAVEHDAASVLLRATIPAQPGYPWRVRLDVRFALGPGGLEQRVIAVNESDAVAPFGVGGHPYLLAGPHATGAIDAWSLELRAERVLLIDDERMLPTGLVAVRERAERFDFRRPRVLGGTELNHAFTELERDDAGWARARLTAPGGLGVEIAWDAASPWAQLYTVDLPGAAEHRHALAIEPMSCPPDALNSGRDLVVLPPGASFETAWVIRRLVR